MQYTHYLGHCTRIQSRPINVYATSGRSACYSYSIGTENCWLLFVVWPTVFVGNMIDWSRTVVEVITWVPNVTTELQYAYNNYYAHHAPASRNRYSGCRHDTIVSANSLCGWSNSGIEQMRLVSSWRNIILVSCCRWWQFRYPTAAATTAASYCTLCVIVISALYSIIVLTCILAL